MKSVLSIAAMLLFLATPAIAADGGDEYANIHTVAVVSAVGDELRLAKHGFGVFGNSVESIPIEGWGLDTWVESKVARAVSVRFAVKPVGLDKTRLFSCDGFDQCAAALPHNDSIDAYIVVFKHWGPSVGTDVRGLGLYHHGLPVGKDMNFIHAIYVIAVVDAKSGDMIDHGSAQLPNVGLFGSDYPMKDISESDWPDSAAQMTDTQKANAKANVVDLISASLSVALTRARLPHDDLGTSSP